MPPPRPAGAAVGRRENRARARRHAPRLGPGVQSVAVREVEVEQQRLEAFPPGEGEEARHRGDRVHLVAPGDEEPCQVLREQLLVLENEYPAGHKFRRSKESARRTRRFPALVLGTTW